MTDRQLGKGLKLGLYEDTYVGLVTEVDEGELMALLTPTQALTLSSQMRDKAYELLNREET
jgi:hypothetical protein